MSRRSLLSAVLVVLSLAGCTSSSITARVRPQVELVAYDSCAQLLTSLRAAAAQNAGSPSLRDGPGAEPEVIAGGARTMMPAFSPTTVHELGADEPDVVKTDGRRIVTVTGGVLRVVDPVTRAQTGRLDLGATGEASVLLAGDHALVLIADRGYQLYERRIRPAGSHPEVLLVDLSGPPRLISRYRGEGTLVDARQTGTVARVVLSSAPRITGDRAAIDRAPLDAWLPGWQITTGATRTAGRLDCGAVSRPASFSGLSLLSVLTFDLTAPALTDGDPIGIVADGDIVYGTPTSLYVADNRRSRLDLAPPARTEIYRFALPATGKPVFTAAGAVPGRLLNQYAMSEWNGDLRVATTDNAVSAVRVLRARDDKLVQVGEVGGLGRGEQIYSVRFAGPRGYVVTFRQTDPLYSVDLSDPAAPRVTGALKITGYSSHLQPIGDDRLIGIGQEAGGAQISLFDVTDPADPRRLARQQVPGGRSAAEFDPHALLWWPATHLLVVPMNSSALALRVEADELRPAGEITQPDPIRRSLVIGAELWTLSDAGLQASQLATLDRVGWVPLS